MHTAVRSELTFYILPSFLLFPCERVNIILFINLEFNGSEYLHGEVDSCAEIQGNSWWQWGWYGQVHKEKECGHLGAAYASQQSPASQLSSAWAPHAVPSRPIAAHSVAHASTRNCSPSPWSEFCSCTYFVLPIYLHSFIPIFIIIFFGVIYWIEYIIWGQW